MGHEMFLKNLLGHEILKSMVPWATKVFLKNLKNPVGRVVPPNLAFTRASTSQILSFIVSSLFF